MLELLERQTKLTANQWKIAGAATLGDMLDFFDFFLIGFVLAFVVKDWHLTYGQSGAILLASGVSAPFGSLLYGWMADKIGRRSALITAVLECFARDRCDGADARRRVDLSGDLPLLCRFRGDRVLFGRHHPDAGVFTGPQARLVHRADDDYAAGGLICWPHCSGLLPHPISAGAGWLPSVCCRRFCASTSAPLSPNRRIGCCARAGSTRRGVRSPGHCRWTRRKSHCRQFSPPIEKTRWLDIFKYPRSIIAGCLTGLTQTGGVALAPVAGDPIRHGPEGHTARGVEAGDLDQHFGNRRSVLLLVDL